MFTIRTAAEPSSKRSGGASLSTSFKIAAVVPPASPCGDFAAISRRASQIGAYAGSSADRFADGPRQSVSNPLGSTSVTLIPNGATSCDSASLKPSSAHFDA